MKKSSLLFVSIGMALSMCAINTYAQAKKELKILAGDNIPPYAIEGTAGGADRGAEIDIIRAALKDSNFSVKFIFVPLGKLGALEAANADGSARMFGTPPGGLTHGYIVYSDCVVTHESRAKMKSLSELKQMKTIAFQGASSVLGSEYKAAVTGAENYKELNNQEVQVRQLSTGQIDAAVGDIYIIRYKLDMLSKEGGGVQKVPVSCNYDLKTPPFGAYFKDKDATAAFNKGLEKIIASGEYKKILDTYGLPMKLK